MRCPENSIYIIIGEMNMLVTAMRRSNRWSSHVHQEEEQDSLLKSFNSLKETLNQLQCFEDLDPILYLSPFLDVIRSENTSGLVTGHGLSALYKFLSYGLIDEKSPSAAVASENIADAVTHARFMMVDASSNEIVFMKIIQVLRLLILSPIGILLTNESICEIIQSFFRMCFETRFSEILRKSAESAVVDTVQLLFSCLPQFTDDSRCANIKKLKMYSCGLDKGRKKLSFVINQKKPNHIYSLKNSYPNCSPTFTSTFDGFKSEAAVNTDSMKESKLEKICPEYSLEPSGFSEELVTSSKSDSMINSHHSESVEYTFSESSNTNRCSLMTSEDGVSDEVTSNKKLELHSALEAKQISDSVLPLQENNSEDSVAVYTSVQGKYLNNYCMDTFHEASDYVNPRGVRFTPHKLLLDGNGPLVPYGLPCVRELFRLLVSLINPQDRHNTDVTIQIGLNLITVALETGADNLGKFNSLLLLIKDEMCRYLFCLFPTDRLTIFASTLRVFFLLFEALRTHLKLQLEMFLTKLMDIITSESSKYSYEQREISLDCLIQLWHIPSFVSELYINYDCDLYCSNLFENITKLLAKNAFPHSGLYSVHLLSLDSLLTVIDNIGNNCHCRMLKLGSQDEGHGFEHPSTESELSAVQKAVSGYHFAQLLCGQNKTEDKSSLFRVKEMKRSPFIQPNRMKVTLDIPSHEELMATKHKKKILASGTEQFNSQPAKGIAFLQEHGLLKKPLDPQEVAAFLRDNPKLDKKMIGEYISSRKNLKVLEAFVKSFSFADIRIDEALRQYLETFRLPGEAPLISLIMEHFAEHWHTSNKLPFANNDAAFTLAYAIIMLNVDQHNHNVKKQNNPMTLEEFKKNLKNVNGGEDFDQEMLEKIYLSIRNEEIVMPAEQTGLVRENYLWKVLLRRGSSKEGIFIHTPNGIFDHDLFSLVWGSAVATLSFIFDKTSDVNVMEKCIAGFHKCAMIAAHYGMTDVFDNLIISLCKFTMLVISSESPKLLPIVFGNNSKAQMATKAVFRLAHCHGDILRDGWKNLLDCILHLFKAKLLPEKLVEAEDFLSPTGVISLIREDLPSIPRAESGIFSSFYSYITSDSPSQRSPSQEDEIAKKSAIDCIKECQCEQLFAETKFLRIDSLQELIKTLIFVCPSPEPRTSVQSTFDENYSVFFLELLVKIILLNRDRIMSIWSGIQDHMFSIIMNAALTDNEYLLERAIVGVLRIAVRLVCKEDMIQQVLQSLKVILYLKPPALLLTSRQVAYALNELLKTNAANIHDEEHWSIIFSLLERVGAGAKPPQSSVCNVLLNETDEALSHSAQSDSEISLRKHTQDSGFISERGYTSDSELYENTSFSSHWLSTGGKNHSDNIEINTETDGFDSFTPLNQYNICLHQELSAHDSLAFLKCCESLAFLVRDAAHITAENFESCVHCLRTFVEASANGGFSERKLKFKHRESKEKKGVRNGAVKRKEGAKKRSVSQRMKGEDYDADDEERQNELSPAYQQSSLQLLDLMHTLHTRAASIFCNELSDVNKCNSVNLMEKNLWSDCWCPLLQGIARLCCDNRLEIRTSALSLLQRALLIHDLQVLTPLEWEACFNKVLFPLLAKLLENISPEDKYGMEETRTRGANLLCKVFLQHLTPLLTLPTFLALWLTILDFMDKYMHADLTGSLAEAIPESLKNMLLVMDTANVCVFQKPENGSRNEVDQMWHITWDRINAFLPSLKDELFRPSIPPPFLCSSEECINPAVKESDVIDQKSEIVMNGNYRNEKENLYGEEACNNDPGCLKSIPPSGNTYDSQESSILISPKLSVILHPPAVPVVSTSRLANVESASNKISVKATDSIDGSTNVPLLLSPSVMNERNVPMIGSQVSPCNLAQASR